MANSPVQVVFLTAINLGSRLNFQFLFSNMLEGQVSALELSLNTIHTWGLDFCRGSRHNLCQPVGSVEAMVSVWRFFPATP